MKYSHKLILLVLIIALSHSCHHNPLKTDEKKLGNAILNSERKTDSANKAGISGRLNDTLNHHHAAIHFKENRSIDRKNPPVEIDIAGNLNNIKEMYLSDIASSIKYIKMDPIPDSKIPGKLKSRYYLLDNYIVRVNLSGIHLYSNDGKYIRHIVSNDYRGVEVKNDDVLFYADYTLIGGGQNIQSNGDKLFYVYTNSFTGQKYVMEYKCSDTEISPPYKFDPENPAKISGLGSVAVDLNHGKPKLPKAKSHLWMFGGSQEFLFKQRELFLFDNYTYSLPSDGDKMMVLLNKEGDTLVQFSMLEKLKNYTKDLQRGTDQGILYEFKGKQFFRPEFNDTIFEVIPPERLLPVYVLRLDKYKVPKQLGVDPDYNLTGKIIPGEWAETHDFIFMTFTKDDYDCPNTRKKKTVKIYHAIYSKINHSLSIVNNNPFDYVPDILKNNIDGGVPVWPSSYMISKNGEIMISFSGTELKNWIKSEKFKSSKAPEARKKELERFIEAVKNNEDILMIVK
jgi:hypothetical protein